MQSYLKSGVYMNLKKAALFMGYREISEDKFLKPVGYSCLAIKTDTLEFVSFLKQMEKYMYGLQEYSMRIVL